MEVLDLFKPLSEIPEMDTSYFQPWTLDKLYQVEPGLATIAAQTVALRCSSGEAGSPGGW